MRAINIRHVGIVVDDLKTSIKWYKKYFDMRVLVKEKLGKKIIKSLFSQSIRLEYVKLGCQDTEKVHDRCPCLLELYETDNEDGFPLWNHIAITVPDATKVYNNMKEDGVIIEGELIKDKLGRNLLFFCRDDDWNMIEVVEEIKGDQHE